MSTDERVSLTFPDGPKLELDQLIDQLVDVAQGVKQAQGRLRALLRAFETVTEDIGLEQVLRHAAEAARALAGARYCALGVIAHDGGLERFIQVGLDEEQVARIGDLPQGKGLLGALIADPRPIRLDHLSEDPRSVGFPPGHPPMDSFLGVPIRVHGDVFGNLYLTESIRGGFTAEDEELVRSLALTAGTAISNARLYDESRLQQRWLAASAEINAQLLAADGEDPLAMIARRTADVADADVVTVTLLAPGETSAVIEVAVGVGADMLRGLRFDLAGSFSGEAMADRVPLLYRSASDAGGRATPIAQVIEVGPTMVLPLTNSAAGIGTLTIVRSAGRPAFTGADLSMASAFADSASVAIELAAARADHQRMILLEDRDRIARDLHDHVIQQLFAIGLTLDGLASSLGPDNPASQRLHDRVADIDRTIRQIRTTIFDLRGPLDGTTTGCRQHVLEIASELTAPLGFAPRVAFAGAIDAVLSESLTDDLLAVVREGLTNAAKYAQATAIDVDVARDVGEIIVTITDNGIGVAAAGTASRSGLANLTTRAARRGGSFSVAAGPTGGTQLTWKAPIA